MGGRKACMRVCIHGGQHAMGGRKACMRVCIHGGQHAMGGRQEGMVGVHAFIMMGGTRTHMWAGGWVWSRNKKKEDYVNMSHDLPCHMHRCIPCPGPVHFKFNSYIVHE